MHCTGVSPGLIHINFYPGRDTHPKLKHTPNNSREAMYESPKLSSQKKKLNIKASKHGGKRELVGMRRLHEGDGVNQLQSATSLQSSAQHSARKQKGLSKMCRRIKQVSVKSVPRDQSNSNTRTSKAREGDEWPGLGTRLSETL